MAVNRYDRAAEAPIMNTYVPINFGELYRIGQAQKQAVDEAANQFNAQLQKFGEFRSPSAVDTQRYYDLTTGRQDVQNAINQIVSNPDALKDTRFRANLQSVINNTDYASLSLLKESANNLRAGLDMRAKMEAEGRYKKSWDTADIPNYDTLGSNKVFDQITPLRYMTADELSNPYFSNLKPSSLGSVWKDGVKYDRTGITYDTLYDIADARFNDLISTPQGQQYYKEALAASNGDRDLARQQFVGMIADSQRDRIVNQDTVNSAWLKMSLAEMARKAKGNGGEEKTTVLPTRQEKITYDLAKQTQGLYGQPVNNKAANDMQRLYKASDNFSIAAQKYAERYQQTNDPEDYAKAIQYQNRAKDSIRFAYDINRKEYLKSTFEDIAKFKLNKDPQSNKDYSRDGYLRGVKAALDKVSNTTQFDKNGDVIFTSLGGAYNEYTAKNGSKTSVYDFESSRGFLLPETVFSQATGSNPVTVKRRAGVFSSDAFPFKEALEGGRFRFVQFKPEASKNTIQIGSNKLISGKIRIPKDEIESVMGTGILGEGANFTIAGKRSARQTLEELYGSVSTEYDKDGSVFYEVPVYKVLPADNNLNYWSKVNAIEQNSPSAGGIGGATQAQEAYPHNIESLLYND